MDPVYFATSSELRAWLERHHDDVRELWIGFYKTRSGRPSIAWQEAVDEALCFGWIDGVRHGIDDTSYEVRFTPRRPRSTWSAVNIERAKKLTRQGRMHPAGLGAFDARADDTAAISAYEQRHAAELDEAEQRRFRANAKAWSWFQAQTTSYRKGATWWVVSAKRDETRAKRLTTLIEDSEHGRAIKPLARR